MQVLAGCHIADERVGDAEMGQLTACDNANLARGERRDPNFGALLRTARRNSPEIEPGDSVTRVRATE
jgi:hypothetical protein